MALAGIAGCSHSADGDPAAEEQETEHAAVTVRVEPAETRTLEQTVKAIGHCEAVVGKLAMLTPAIEGHVHSILVEPGATVKAGQPIIELDRTLPEADLAEKLAMLETAKASLALLESLPRIEEQKISKLAIEQARVAFERAQSLVEQLKPLSQRNEVSRQQMFDAEKAVEQTRLQQETAAGQYAVSMLGPRAEASDEAKARVLVAEAAVKTSQARLDLHTLRAPIDGVLQLLTCHPGQTIAAGTSVGEIVDLRELEVLAWLPARTARSCRIGQKAVVRVPRDLVSAAVADDEATENVITAEVNFVGQTADPLTGNLPVRARIEHADSVLAVGQTVNLAITVAHEEQVLCVPTAAVFDLGEGPIINVVRDGKSVELHPRLGTAHEGWIAVADTDLAAGEPVIIEGGYNLKDETPVTIEAAEEGHEAHDEG